MGSLRECICTSVAGAREDLEWARLLSAVAVSQDLPRRLNGGQALVAFETKPVLDVGPGDEWERQIGRRMVDGEVRSLLYTLHVYMYTVDIVF